MTSHEQTVKKHPQTKTNKQTIKSDTKPIKTIKTINNTIENNQEH